MTHDPLCDSFRSYVRPCICDLIARVREDERSMHADDLREYGARGERNGYAAAMRDAKAAVMALPLVAAFTGELAIIRRPQAVAAIEALGKEQSDGA